MNGSGEKTTNEKPVSVHPLSFKEALAALLKTKPPPKEDKIRDAEGRQSCEPEA